MACKDQSDIPLPPQLSDFISPLQTLIHLHWPWTLIQGHTHNIDLNTFALLISLPRKPFHQNLHDFSLPSGLLTHHFIKDAFHCHPK